MTAHAEALRGRGINRLSIPPKILLWACERAGHEPSDLERRIPQLPAWIRGEKRPTLRQLEKLAKATHAPLGYLFLPEPPDEPLPIHDFRTVMCGPPNRPSPDLLETLYTMQRRQAWLREWLVEIDAEPLDFSETARITDDPEAVGREMRQTLGLDNGWAANVPTWKEAVSALRRTIEERKVMAVINGVVGNDTHRKLRVEEFRGFALADRYAPLIFVNGRDARSAQMFTLAHEFAHIWLGEEGLSGFADLFPGGSDVEDWCNAAAAEFLVPAADLRVRWPDLRRQTKRFETLAREFKVSPVVIARRALDLNLVDRGSFSAFYHDRISRERRDAATTTGGDFYANQNARVGTYFTAEVLRAALEARIGFREAYDLTGLRGQAFRKYAKRLDFDLP